MLLLGSAAFCRTPFFKREERLKYEHKFENIISKEIMDIVKI